MAESDLVLDDRWGRRHRILRRIETSVCYHRKRERFFEISDRVVKAIALFGGSSAFVNLVGADKQLAFATIATAVIALGAAIALVFGFAERGKRHGDLARNFLELEAQIVGKGEHDFNDADLDAWEARTRTLELSEPAGLNALVVICQNEVQSAAGHKPVALPRMHRLLAHFCSFPIVDENQKSTSGTG